MIDIIDPPPKQPTHRNAPKQPGAKGLPETVEFAHRRKKNRVRNKQQKASRRKNR